MVLLWAVHIFHRWMIPNWTASWSSTAWHEDLQLWGSQSHLFGWCLDTRHQLPISAESSTGFGSEIWIPPRSPEITWFLMVSCCLAAGLPPSFQMVMNDGAQRGHATVNMALDILGHWEFLMQSMFHMGILFVDQKQWSFNLHLAGLL